ncbi:f3f79a54-22b5-4e16-9c5e-3a6ae34b98e8 [Sclerotinia trifoliorum]|uniref:F3f79a54-22b5-4e16-9c5e-3a6ae34b98e8 n=1 Tax=Sclerotinia trifoliorum TaxID=28548 RepID=A0A8H2W1I4_9HELO|nr:f3f79a54-22b5-4e16-9c5e-3a6ae34b98e8 [Sclerotinia trifoliorum]
MIRLFGSNTSFSPQEMIPLTSSSTSQQHLIILPASRAGNYLGTSFLYWVSSLNCHFFTVGFLNLYLITIYQTLLHSEVHNFSNKSSELSLYATFSLRTSKLTSFNMSSSSGTSSPSMPNSSAESSSWRATSQEDSSDRSDVYSSRNSSPAKSLATKPVTAKKQKLSEKTAKFTATDKGGNALDEDIGQERKLNSSKATIIQKKPVSKTATVAEVDSDSDGGEPEERPIKKPVAASKSKSKSAITKNTAAKAKKNAEVRGNATLTVSDAKDAESTGKPAPTSKLRKRRAAIPTNDGARKRARLPQNTYTPDSYEGLNKEDKLLFDLKTRSPEATWRDLVEEFNLKLQSNPRVNLDALRMRWPRVKAAATEIAHGDIQKMCVYKQDMEVQLETTREELLAKFERDKEAILRKFKADMWTEIAKYVAQDGGNQYEPATLQRKYGFYQRQGRIDENDKYVAWMDQDEKGRKAKKRSKTLMEENDAEASEGDDEESDVGEKAEDDNDDDDEEDKVDAKGEDEYMSHGED